VPDRLRVAVRLRSPWEAADLGLALLRAQAGPVFRVWLATVAPLALLLGLACHRRPWLAAFILWWLKPLLDRPVLHVLARGTFGTAPGLVQTLREAPGYCRRGLAATLLWRRLSPERSLLLPVWQLEAATGAGFRARRRLLLRRGGGEARLLTLVCLGFMAVLALGLVAGLDYFWPGGAGPGPLARAFTGGAAALPWLQHLAAALPTLAMAALEPVYLACGYGLYLNRRVQLEGWDLELHFRELAARIRRAGRSAALLLLLALAWAGPGLRAGDPPGQGSGAASAPKEALREVLKDPEFSGRKRIWRLRTSASPRPAPARGFRLPLAGLASALKLLIPAVLAGLLGYALWTRLRGRRPARAAAPEAAAPGSGLDPGPARLPADLAGTALRLWDQGDPRAALALLYQGALAQLAAGPGRPPGAGATEAECLRLAADLPQAGYLARLLAAWQAVAYGGRAPAPGDRDLCAGWAAQFPGGGR